MISLVRELSTKDIELLKKLAPECAGLVCSGSRAPYRSILPPVSNHYSRDEEDFRRRMSLLDTGELAYLVSLIRNGEESLGCVPPQYIEVFLGIVEEKMGTQTAEELLMVYLSGRECPPGNVIDLK
ncbi:hypothetical protein [Methanolobus chelungpuianus]|uniref:hypothetical protein n=1 Tax=Methanolobus chelungpuianus TaxID=502115 RepID=UPI002115687F